MADGQSEKLENLFEGKLIPVIEQGNWPENLQAENMTEFEFLAELRINGVEQLGQVRVGYSGKPTGKLVSTTMRIETSKPVRLFLPPHNVTLPFRATMNMPAHGVAQFLSSAPGINNYVPLRKCRMVAGQQVAKRVT